MEQEEARQQERERTQAEETQAPPQQDQEIKQAQEGHNESIKQETHTATISERPITGPMSALTLRPNNKRSCICTSRPREKGLKSSKRGISS